MKRWTLEDLAASLPSADNGRNLLRAFDKTNGRVVAEIELPLRPNGTPMTYIAGGKQYIAMTVGGNEDNALVALTLPGTIPSAIQ